MILKKEIIYDNNIYSDEQLEKLYFQIYINIEKIKESYEFLDPETNNLTKELLNNGFTYDEAFTKSFMTTILLYFDLYT